MIFQCTPNKVNLNFVFHRNEKIPRAVVSVYALGDAMSSRVSNFKPLERGK